MYCVCHFFTNTLGSSRPILILSLTGGMAECLTLSLSLGKSYGACFPAKGVRICSSLWGSHFITASLSGKLKFCQNETHRCAPFYTQTSRLNFSQYAGVWPNSDGFLIFIFFLLYIITIIAHGFLIRYLRHSCVCMLHPLAVS